MISIGKIEFSKLAHLFARVTGHLNEVVQTTTVYTKPRRNGRTLKARIRVKGDKVATKMTNGTFGSRNGQGFLMKFQPWKLTLSAPSVGHE